MPRIKVIGLRDRAAPQSYRGWSIPRRGRAAVPPPNIMRVFGLRPEYLEVVCRGFNTLWGGTLPRTVKEMIAVTVSKATHCHY
jgi:alkylhydroperoxidase family enzyme